MARPRPRRRAKAAAVVTLSGFAAAGGAWSNLSATSSSTGSVTATAGTSTSSGASSGTSTSNSKADRISFTVTVGAVPGGLVLGGSRRLPVTVVNGPGNKAKTTMRLKRVVVSATDAGPGCPASDLSVGGYDAAATAARDYTLAAGASATLDLPISLLDQPVPQDACKGRSFPLTVTATAEVFK